MNWQHHCHTYLYNSIDVLNYQQSYLHTDSIKFCKNIWIGWNFSTPDMFFLKGLLIIQSIFVLHTHLFNPWSNIMNRHGSNTVQRKLNAIEEFFQILEFLIKNRTFKPKLSFSLSFTASGPNRPSIHISLAVISNPSSLTISLENFIIISNKSTMVLVAPGHSQSLFCHIQIAFFLKLTNHILHIIVCPAQ